MQSDSNGFVDKFLEGLQEHSKLKINIHKMPVQRSLNSYQTGRYSFHLGATDNFTEDVNSKSYIIPIIDLDIHILMKKVNESKFQKKFKDLKNIRIGILRGAEQEETFAKDHNFLITRYIDLENATNLLDKDRVDLITFIPLFNTNKDIVGSSSMNNFVYHHDICYSSKAAFFLHRDSPNSAKLYKNLKTKITQYLQSSEYRALLVREFGNKIPTAANKYTKK